MLKNIAYIQINNSDKVGIIDAELAEDILKYNWYLDAKKNYFCTRVGGRITYLSKYIAQLAGYDSEKRKSHYKNKDTLDNRLENLDIKELSTGIPGFYYSDKHKTWRIETTDEEGRRYNLAEFKVKEDALNYYRTVCNREPKKYLEKHLVSKADINRIRTKINNLKNLSIEGSDLQKLSQQAQDLIAELQNKLSKIESIINNDAGDNQ